MTVFKYGLPYLTWASYVPLVISGAWEKYRGATLTLHVDLWCQDIVAACSFFLGVSAKCALEIFPFLKGVCTNIGSNDELIKG